MIPFRCVYFCIAHLLGSIDYSSRLIPIGVIMAALILRKKDQASGADNA